MKIKNNFKFFILFLCFYYSYSNDNNASENATNNICRRLRVATILPFRKKKIYYCSKNRTITRPNQSSVFTKNILRKYIYIINIVVVYVILLSI